jgi:hypothetical protein
MTTLVIDAGQNLVGVYSVEEEEYAGYRGCRTRCPRSGSATGNAVHCGRSLRAISASECGYRSSATGL